MRRSIGARAQSSPPDEAVDGARRNDVFFRYFVQAFFEGW